MFGRGCGPKLVSVDHNVLCPFLLDVKYTFPWVPSNLTVYVGDSVIVSLFVGISFEHNIIQHHYHVVLHRPDPLLASIFIIMTSCSR